MIWRVINNVIKNKDTNSINMNNNKSDSENSNNFNKYVTTIGADLNNSFNNPYKMLLYILYILFYLF